MMKNTTTDAVRMALGLNSISRNRSNNVGCRAGTDLRGMSWVGVMEYS
jgi:hypothetical protein